MMAIRCRSFLPSLIRLHLPCKSFPKQLHFCSNRLTLPRRCFPFRPSNSCKFFSSSTLIRLKCDDNGHGEVGDSSDADSEKNSDDQRWDDDDLSGGERFDSDIDTDSDHGPASNDAAASPKESLRAFIRKASGLTAAEEEHDTEKVPRSLERKEQRVVSRNETESPVKIRYVRYADSFLLGIDGPVELVKKIQRRITDFLQNELKLEADSNFTHVRAGKVDFLGTVIQAVPLSAIRKPSKALEMRRRVKHRIRQIAAQRRFSIQTRIENLGKNILARQLKRGKRETGSLQEAGLQLAETLKSAGVTAESDPLREAAHNIQQKLREILRSVGWSNMPPDVQEAFLRLDESLGSWMSSFETSGGGGRMGTRRVAEGAIGKDDGGQWEDDKPVNQFVIKILAPINILVLRLRSRGIIAEKKALPTHVGRLSNLDDEDIVNWFSCVAKGFLAYYRCCDNFDQVKAIVDYHIRWSAIFTLAHKHKSSARKIIKKISKDLVIVDGEGRVIAKYPNSLEIKTIKRGFFERKHLIKDDADKILDFGLIRYSKADSRTDTQMSLRKRE